MPLAASAARVPASSGMLRPCAHSRRQLSSSAESTACWEEVVIVSGGAVGAWPKKHRHGGELPGDTHAMHDAPANADPLQPAFDGRFQVFGRLRQDRLVTLGPEVGKGEGARVACMQAGQV